MPVAKDGNIVKIGVEMDKSIEGNFVSDNNNMYHQHFVLTTLFINLLFSDSTAD